jgi:hypothetical protein
VRAWSERLNFFWQWNRPDIRVLPVKFCVGSEQTNREIPSHGTKQILPWTAIAVALLSVIRVTTA